MSVTTQSRGASVLVICTPYAESTWKHPPYRPAPAVAAFFDLDKTVISKSSTLAFGRPFYQYGLISRADALRSVAGHLVYRVAGANHGQMERVREWVTGLCRDWPVTG